MRRMLVHGNTKYSIFANRNRKYIDMRYFLYSLLSLLFIPACIIINDDNDGCPWAKGSYITEEIPFPALRGFELNMHADVYYTYGASQRVLVHARSEVLDELSTDVRNGIWEIELDRCLRYEDVEIEITTPYIDEIELAGSGLIRSTNFIKTQQDLDLTLTGSGDIDLGLDVDDLEADLIGSGDLDLEGIGDELDIYLSGSGDINAFDLEVQEANIEIVGSGDVRTTVLQSLRGRITGSGDIYYKGTPVLDVEITGSGELINAN